MNNIELRAWDIKKKEYFKPGKVIGFYIFQDEITIWYVDDTDDGLPNYKKFHVKGIILEQYTGRKDKKDKKIFKGDTLQWFNAPGMIDTIGNVIWYNDRSVYYIENDEQNIYDELYNVFDYSEIIGTIHDDPELLK